MDEHGNIDEYFCQRLIEVTDDINHWNDEDQTALDFAMKCKEGLIIDLLIDNGAKTHAKMSEQNSFSMYEQNQSWEDGPYEW